MASLFKNTASQKVTFCLVNATTGAALTTATFTSLAWVTVDGSQAGFAGSFTTLGNGQFQYAPTQAETNGTDIGILITVANAVPVNLDFHTDLVDSTGNLQVDAVRINNVATTSVTTVNANQGTTQPVNFTGTGGSALVKGDAIDINSVAASSVTTINANVGTTQPINFTGTAGSALVQSDVIDIAGSATGGTNLSHTTGNIGRGTCAGGGSTTSVTTSAFTPGGASIVMNQFVGRTMIFDGNTATGALQGQASNITSNTSGATPTFTVSAMTTAPSSGDVFTIV